MKKNYSAPEILFEDFTISTSIATNCEEKSDLQNARECGFKWGKFVIFINSTTGCSKEVVDGDSKYNGLCYHVPEADYNLFNS